MKRSFSSAWLSRVSQKDLHQKNTRNLPVKFRLSESYVAVVVRLPTQDWPQGGLVWLQGDYVMLLVAATPINGVWFREEHGLESGVHSLPLLVTS